MKPWPSPYAATSMGLKRINLDLNLADIIAGRLWLASGGLRKEWSRLLQIKVKALSC